MAVNKVVFGDQTVMDITDSTVDSDSLLTGVKAYGANGNPVIGGVVKSWTGTAAQYAQEASQISDGTQVNILDDFTPVGTPIGIAEIYSTEEREVGVWIDGKPLYQKTLYIPALPSTKSTGTYSLNVLNAENCWIIDANSGTGNLNMIRVAEPSINDMQSASVYVRCGVIDNDIKVYVEVGRDRSAMSAYVTVRYTKTTDQPGSGKYVPSGAPAIHYSTDEQIIGTWIDGTPLYQKTIDLGNLPNNTTTNVSTEISNAKRLINYFATATDSNGGQIAFPRLWIGGTGDIYIGFGANLSTINIATTSDRSGMTGYCTVQYTKTTD